MMWMFPLNGFSGQLLDEFAEAFSGIEFESGSPRSDSGAPPYYMNTIKKLPTEQKEELAAKLTQLLPRLAMEQIATGSNNSLGGTVESGISVLNEIGTDEQKIVTFRDLNLYRSSLAAACEAVASCKIPDGIQILKQHAEKQFTTIEAFFGDVKKNPMRQPDEFENSSFINFFVTIKALYGAYHTGGPIAAEAFRSKFFKIYEDYGDRARMDLLAQEIDKDIIEMTERREKILREKEPERKRLREQESNKGESPARSSSVSSAGNTSNGLYGLGISITGSLVILALAGWFMVKRRQKIPPLPILK